MSDDSSPCVGILQSEHEPGHKHSKLWKTLLDETSQPIRSLPEHLIPTSEEEQRFFASFRSNSRANHTRGNHVDLLTDALLEKSNFRFFLSCKTCGQCFKCTSPEGFELWERGHIKVISDSGMSLCMQRQHFHAQLQADVSSPRTVSKIKSKSPFTGPRYFQRAYTAPVDEITYRLEPDDTKEADLAQDALCNIQRSKSTEIVPEASINLAFLRISLGGSDWFYNEAENEAASKLCPHQRLLKESRKKRKPRDEIPPVPSIPKKYLKTKR